MFYFGKIRDYIRRKYALRRGFKEPKRCNLRWELVRGHDWRLFSVGEDSILACSIRWEPMTSGIRIGSNTYIGSNTSLTSIKGIWIGSNVLISDFCVISDTDGHSTDFISRKLDVPNRWKGLKDWSCVASSEIKILDGAWIGAFSIILKGVTVGERSIIGAGSVVTRDVPDNTIAAGNPAKVVRQLPEW